MTIKDLYEARAKAWAEAEDLRSRVNAEGFDHTKDGDTVLSYNRALDEVERLAKRIEDEERAEKLAGVMGQNGGNTAPGHREAPKDERSADEQYRDAFYEYLRSGDEASPEARRLLAEKRTANLTSTNGDGNLIPVTTLQKMTQALKAFGGVYSLAEVAETSTGNPVNWPTADTTAEVGSIVAEGGPVGLSSTSFGQKTLGAYIYTSGIIQLSWQLMQDNVFDLEGYVARKIGERIGRAIAADFVSGNGTTAPQGLITGLSLTVTGDTVANGARVIGAPTYNNLVDLVHKIDPAYRALGNCGFLVADTTVAEFRKLVDSQKRPLWEPSLQNGDPDRFMGYPVRVDQGVPAVGSAAKSVVFGDIKQAYVVRHVTGAQAVRLNELYAANMLTGFFGIDRYDAKVQNAGAAAFLTGGTA
jgi:HK97 family phage major capsid protein